MIKAKKNVAMKFILPFMIFFFIFRVYPIIYSFILSFHSWDSIGSWEFIGLGNYIKIFTNEVALKSIQNTAIMAVGQLIISIPIALALALLINNKNLAGNYFFRATYFLPRIVSVAITAIIFQNIFHNEYGIVNYFLTYFNIIKEPISWWTNGAWAKVSIILIRSWMIIPFMMIYFLTGLQSIPIEIYDATKIDGAKPYQEFLYVTLPLLKPITLFVFVTGTVTAVQIFTIPYMLTGGGPSNSTISIIQYMYISGLNNFQFGYSSAISIFVFVLLSLIAYIQFKISHKDGV